MLTGKMLALSLSMILQHSFAQEYPKDYFRSPLDIPILLSGNFCELRTNHFHTGLDMKTNGVEGLKIYATAEGHISRIKVSHYGYGKALYMDHPNGLTTVYAHLQSFSPAIERYVKQKQYEQQTEEIELTDLPDSLFVFKKGEVIARSGNTGHSGGPHLHFEIRETASENALNPLLFGFDIKDNIAPTLKHVRIYPLDDSSFINGKNAPLTVPLSRGSGKYALKAGYSIKATGRIGMAIHAVDMLNGSGNICGIYTSELKLNGETIFGHRLNHMEFEVNRYINAHMDYLAYRDHKDSYHKSFINGNNLLPIYYGIKENGIVKVDGELSAYRMSYTVTDAYGNTSNLDFSVDHDPQKYPIDLKKEELHMVPFAHESSYITEAIRFVIPAFGVYENLQVRVTQGEKAFRSLSPWYRIGSEDYAVQDYFDLYLKPDTVHASFQEKMLIGFRDRKGRLSAQGGSWNDSLKMVHGKVRSFGSYAVLIDSIAPVISPVNISEGKSFAATKYILLNVSDDLSGILKYDAYIDEQWILSHYNTKRGRISVDLDAEKVLKGDHQFKLIVKDERGNSATFEAGFTR